jgi:hypothetical protein
VGKEAVLGANVCLTSTKIIDVTGETPVEMKGYVPARSVVIQGVIPNLSSWRFSSTLRINYWYTQTIN